MCDEKKKTKKEEGRAFVAPFDDQLIRGKADTTNEQRGAAKTEDRDDNKEHHTASMVRTWQKRHHEEQGVGATPKPSAHPPARRQNRNQLPSARHGTATGVGLGRVWSIVFKSGRR